MNKQGFTLIETVLVITLLAFIIFNLALIIFNFSNFNVYFSQSLSLDNQVNLLLQSIDKELKSAIQSSNGSYPLDIATSNELAFYTNIDNDSLIERVRYFKASSSLQKGIIKPIATGSGLYIYPTSSEIRNVLVDQLASGTEPLFQYYDSNLQSTNKITSIRLIKFTIYIKENKNANITENSVIIAPRNLITTP
ncbi:MAG: hypothetical protein KatS3mg097_050 [Candidatus Parcubacteria bacterium]|nr:MAG: hypothetical protein KatS3mg097_050 [Candidatus Parcubacteria bacterium]